MLKRFTATSLDLLAKKTVKVKGGDFQMDLLRATRNGAQFAPFVLSAMQSGDGEIVDGKQELELPETPFSEREFSDPPTDTMREMAALWPGMEKRDACAPGVWARVNLRMVENGLIEPVFFAGGQNGGGNSKGAHRIDEAFRLLSKGREEGEKAIDGCARRIVRCFAGCPRIRGIRTLYQDCTPARAWWVCRLADEAAQELAQNEQGREKICDAVLDILQRKAVWENLSERIVSSLTVLGDDKIRNGIILFLTESRRDRDGSRFLKGDDLKRLFRRIGQMCAWRALGYFGSEGVSDIIRGDIVPTIPPKPSKH